MNDAQKRAYEWAINRSYPSVAAQYAKTLAEMVEELNRRISVLTDNSAQPLCCNCDCFGDDARCDCDDSPFCGRFVEDNDFCSYFATSGTKVASHHREQVTIAAEDLRAMTLGASSLMFHPELDEHQAESYGGRLHWLRDRLGEFVQEAAT